MIEIEDEVFGKIAYDIYWKRSYTLPFLGIDRDISLVIDGDEDSDFEDSQYKAFESFEEVKSALMLGVENGLYEYYQSNVSENRAKFGEQADELSPIISSKEELNNLLKPKQVIVMESFELDDLNIGLVFEAKWEPELGIGVKLVNGKLVEIGHQDIVL